MSSPTLRRALALLGGVALAVLATGCGSDGPEAATEPDEALSSSVESSPEEVEPVGALVLRPVLGTGGTPDGVDLLADADGLVSRLGPMPGGPALIESVEVVESPPGQWGIAPLLIEGDQGIDRLNRLASLCLGGLQPECPANSLGSNRSGAVAVVVGDEVVSAPEINAMSFERDQILISGRDEAYSRSVAARLTAEPTATSLPR